MTDNPRTKIQPILVEVSLRNAIARRLREHGVPEFDSIANEVTLELTGKHVVNPPSGVPHTFVIEGVRLHWPQGLDTRVPTAEECEPFNRALNGVSNDRMSTEDNVRVLRACYQALWTRVRIHANERAQEISNNTSWGGSKKPCAHNVIQGTPEGALCLMCDDLQPTSVQKPSAPVVTTSMLEGRNPVLEASVGDDGAVTVKPKRKRKKVEPVVSTENTLASLQDDLTSLRKTLEGAEG